MCVTTGSISISSFVTVIGEPVRIVSVGCSFEFSISTGTVKKLLKMTRNEKKKHNKITMLARIKWNSFESKISKAFINSDINHEDFVTTIDELKKI